MCGDNYFSIGGQGLRKDNGCLHNPLTLSCFSSAFVVPSASALASASAVSLRFAFVVNLHQHRPRHRLATSSLMVMWGYNYFIFEKA
jgi:hypothetical protein